MKVNRRLRRLDMLEIPQVFELPADHRGSQIILFQLLNQCEMVHTKAKLIVVVAVFCK
ncbi:hypothetical protein D3C86_1860920 [compost metagenome]